MPIIYVIAFVIGIIFIVTADTGLITSYYPALIAGVIISCFAGVFLAIYLYAWHKQSKWVMSIPVLLTKKNERIHNEWENRDYFHALWWQMRLQKKRARTETLTDFLCSKTGKALYDEKTKLWCNGPAYIAELYREELKKSGYQIWDECISVCLCWEINSYKIIVYADTLFVKVLTVFIQS